MAPLALRARDNGPGLAQPAVLPVQHGAAGATGPTGATGAAGSATTAAIITTTNANYTVLGTDYTVLCNFSTTAKTVTLPAAASNPGRIYVIRRIGSTACNVASVEGATVGRAQLATLSPCNPTARPGT